MERTYIGPAFADAMVSNAMRVGVITCRPETKLTDVASMMVAYDTHSVVVHDMEGGDDASQWGIVTSLDIARNARTAGKLESLTAGDVATNAPVTVASNEPLERAATLMAEHGVSHLIAVQPDTGRPAGVISARSIAAAVAFGH